MTAPFPRLPRAFSVTLLGLLLAFNAVTAALHPAQPALGEIALTKLTTPAPVTAQFRETAAIAKASAGRTHRLDDGPGNDPALPAGSWAPTAPTISAARFGISPDAAAPADTPRAYRARAPPFAA